MIRLGFIGVGFVAQQCHLPAFDSIPGCEIIAVSDLQLDLAQKIGARYEVAKIYKNHEELLQDPDIDAVVITVPRSLTVDGSSSLLFPAATMYHFGGIVYVAPSLLL